MKHLTMALPTLALSAILAGSAWSKTFEVGPGESVQAAVDAATSGDTIVISGIHRENVSVNNAGLTLVGQNGTIDGQYFAYSVAVWVPDVTIKGLKVIHGAPGIRVIADRVEVRDCTFKACEDHALEIDGDDAVIRKNDFESGGGVRYLSATAQSDSRFEKNEVKNCESVDLEGGRLSVQDNSFVGCGGVSVAVNHASESSLVKENVATSLGDAGFVVRASSAGSVVVVGSESRRSRGDGLRVETFDAASALVKKNKIVASEDDGLKLIHGSSGVFGTYGNQVDWAGREGIDARVDGSGVLLLRHDVVERAEEEGIEVSHEVGATGVILVVQAKVRDTGYDGLRLSNEPGVPFTVSGCDVRRALGRGIRANGVGITLLDNDVRQCDGDGIFASGGDFVVRGNSVKSCAKNGIEFSFSVGGVSVIEENVVRKCGRDGFQIHGGAQLIDNQSNQNRGDGIDVASGSFVLLDGNVCLDNAHEGIDNSGTNTTIANNQMFGNGGTLGPDLAGRGTGSGTTTFGSSVNQFGSGGLTTLQRLDQ